MQKNHPILLNTYELAHSATNTSVRCCGCRQLSHPGLDTPAHIVGIIEFEDTMIPVIDPALQLFGEPTPVTATACILVIHHMSNDGMLHTGIILAHSQEILELAAGCYDSCSRPMCTTNMLFVLETRSDADTGILLAENHRAIASSLRPVSRQIRHVAAGPSVLAEI